MISVGSDFSGVGAFDQALRRLGVGYKTVFACDMDKYARQTYIHNYGAPDYYPENVYEREIPVDPLDIFMTSPPCQAFSLAGKRKGEADKRGILFYNSHEFIAKNRPRYFIFENVKGLLSDDNGKTFRTWVEYLGGKSINGNPIIFPHPESVPYHIYYTVLNAKNYGIPQNRERVFIVGIRDDEDNQFTWPKPWVLDRRLKDVLEPEVDEKYYLSEKMLAGFVNHSERHNEKGTGFAFSPKNESDIANTIRANASLCPTDNMLIVGNLNKGGQRGVVYSENTNLMSCLAATDYKQPKQIQVKEATKQGYAIAKEGDSINLSNPNSETRRGRVGDQIANTLDTACNQEVVIGQTTNDRIAGWHQNENVVGAHRNDTKRSSVSEHIYHKEGGVCTTIQTAHVPKVITHRIRRLTPRECFRLMDFPETFSWPVSDSQAYKQAGNSICVGVLAEILNKIVK